MRRMEKRRVKKGGREGGRGPNLHFVDSLVSRNLIRGDEEVLLLDGQGSVAKGWVVPHLTLGVETIQVCGEEERKEGREGGRVGGWISWSRRRESWDENEQGKEG